MATKRKNNKAAARPAAESAGMSKAETDAKIEANARLHGAEPPQGEGFNTANERIFGAKEAQSEAPASKKGGRSR